MQIKGAGILKSMTIDPALNVRTGFLPLNLLFIQAAPLLDHEFLYQNKKGRTKLNNGTKDSSAAGNLSS
jgi:hypothetical protein